MKRYQIAAARAQVAAAELLGQDIEPRIRRIAAMKLSEGTASPSPHQTEREDTPSPATDSANQDPVATLDGIGVLAVYDGGVLTVPGLLPTEKGTRAGKYLPVVGFRKGSSVKDGAFRYVKVLKDGGFNYVKVLKDNGVELDLSPDVTFFPADIELFPADIEHEPESTTSARHRGPGRQAL